MAKTSAIARVAVPVPVYGLYDYRINNAWPMPGARVLVPFGRRQQVGLVVTVERSSDLPAERLKNIEQILDPEPLLDAALLQLCRWCARYYHHPLGEVLSNALPSALRRVRAAERATSRAWRALSTTAAEQVLPKRAPLQRALYQAIQDNGQSMAHSDLLARWPTAAQPLQRLAARGLIAAIDEPQALLAGRGEQPAPALTAAQQAALSAAREQGARFAPLLLDGVTGSGKTEVYFQRMADVLAKRRQVLYLAPEIGLTPQLIERVRQRFAARIGVLHSARSDGERANVWLAARAGEADIVIGTRSAVFTPLPRLGLIIVDEEHDGSYKQQDGFRYHARDVALRRAQNANVPIMLGSATPALETLHNSQSGRYQHLRLPRRASGKAVPRISVIDVRARTLCGGLSAPLLARIGQHLAAGNQVMLFINRRGYAPALLCHDCGWIAPCTRCDAAMTLHRGGRRIDCHHCGAVRPAPPRCGQCGGGQLIATGTGTERVTATLRAHFPDTRIARFDRDSMARKGRLQAQLAAVASGETQLLVGIIDVDGGLFSVDFRAPEHMAQLITQVAGRAGRGAIAGEVLLQTHHPEHPQLAQLLQTGYPGFAAAALDERRAAALPPFGHLALLRAEAGDLQTALKFLQAVHDRVPATAGAEYWGPVPAPMTRRAGRFRAQLLLHSTTRKVLHPLLDRWQAALAQLPQSRRVRWSIDVDPQTLF
ncbi:MAG TPA: primosomal protein N' [Salinisphaeraceae bacterium]|nr:primosomal protein N' [Salinisphaeraceae bacterium]